MVKTIERSHYRVTFMVLLVGVSAYSLLQSLVIPALNTIQINLHTSQASVTWVVTAYLLTASIFTPIMGRLGDTLGKEKMLIVTLSALGVGSVVAGLSHSIVVLVIGRAIQGVGGGVMPLSFGIIRDEFPASKIPSGVGVVAAMTAVGGGIGLVVAGPIITHLGFHWLFWIPLFFIVACTICVWAFVPESPVRSPGRISWTSGALMSAWLVAVILAVSEAPLWGWGSWRVVGLEVLGVILILAWLSVERRSDNPLVDLRMMRLRAVWTNNLVSFLFGVGMYSVFAFLPEFLQTSRSTGYGFGASIVTSGLYLLPMTVMMFLFGLLTGRIAAKIGSRYAVIIGSSLSCSGYLVLAAAHRTSWEIYLVSTLLGVGLGLAFSAMSNLIVQAVPPGQTGIASGMNANIRTIGGALGAAVMSSIVASGSAGGLPRESGYTDGFLFLGVVTVFAILAAVLIPSLREAGPGEHHLAHAELAIVPGGTLTEG